jgi:hypothetical protein
MKEKIERGCGKTIDYSFNDKIMRVKCGKWERMPTPEINMHLEWCDICKTKLLGFNLAKECVLDDVMEIYNERKD